MLDDDNVAITAQTRACINHFTVCSSYDGLTSITADVHAFITAAKVGKDVTVGRTLPCAPVATVGVLRGAGAGLATDVGAEYDGLAAAVEAGAV